MTRLERKAALAVATATAGVIVSGIALIKKHTRYLTQKAAATFGPEDDEEEGKDLFPESGSAQAEASAEAMKTPEAEASAEEAGKEEAQASAEEAGKEEAQASAEEAGKEEAQAPAEKAGAERPEADAEA